MAPSKEELDCRVRVNQSSSFSATRRPEFVSQFYESRLYRCII